MELVTKKAINNMKGFSSWILLGSLCVIFACESNSVFNGKKDFSDKYWSFNDPAEFEFEITETDKPYNFFLNIRNTSKYQFQNITTTQSFLKVMF